MLSQDKRREFRALIEGPTMYQTPETPALVNAIRQLLDAYEELLEDYEQCCQEAPHTQTGSK